MRSHPVPMIAFTVLFGTALLAQQAQPPAPAAGQQAQAPRRIASPPGTAATQVGGQYTKTAPDAPERYTGGKWIEVTYGRPILRSRADIFGSGAEYGKKVRGTDALWRAGANNTTRFVTEVPLVFDGKKLPAGEYSLFVDLKPDAWTLVFSKQPFQAKYDPDNKTETWGATNADPAQDVLRVPMKVATSPTSMDQFTIAFVDMTQTGGKLMLWWEKTMATAAFTVGS
ncbi:MAG: DUF2911 domain-containing protein [Candidatus Rokuibacteriota bacterium]|nr:MAG: DUF2911 domain-containing protein [Candidatus Rokubacteria bacterium]